MPFLLSVAEKLKENGFCAAAPLITPSQAVVVALFPYETQTVALPCESATAYIDVFARKNHYREMVCRLKTVASELRQQCGLRREAIRIFVNSQLPEKEWAVAAGLGFKGKSTLLVSPTVGVNTLIGGLLFSNPIESECLQTAAAQANHAVGCRNCRACIDACPTKALSDSGFDRSRCLQHYASRVGELPPSLKAHWDIIYGCSRCRDACPYNRFNCNGVVHHRGEIDASDSLGDWLTVALEGEEAFGKRLQATALAMSWIKKRALIRNVVTVADRLGLFRKECEEVCFLYENEFSSLLR